MQAYAIFFANNYRFLYFYLPFTFVFRDHFAIITDIINGCVT